MTQPQIKTDIEARVQDTGDIMTGNLHIERDSSPALFIKHNEKNSDSVFQFNGDRLMIWSRNTAGVNEGSRFLTLNTPAYISDIKKSIGLIDVDNEGNLIQYYVYGTHNKPTADDVGALPKTGGELSGDLYLLTGNNDRYIWFDYSADSASMGASWRLGMLGTGTGDNNRFVIQTTGSTTGTTETWRDVISCWMDTKQVDVFGNVVAKKDTGAPQFMCYRTDNGQKISIMVGSGGINKGLYDDNLDAWLTYTDSADVYLATNTAYSKVYLGSTIVYTNEDGWLYSKGRITNNRESAGGGIYVTIGDVQYARLTAATAGTAGDGTNNGTAGIATLYLGNSTAQSSTADTGAHNAYGRILMYSTLANYNVLRVITGTTANYTNYLPAKTGVLVSTNIASSTSKRYIMGVSAIGSTSTSAAVNAHASIYTQSGVLYGAAWNDYAEFRESTTPVEPGRCVKELGNGKLQQTQSRLEPGCLIVSDTFGYAIGQTEVCNTPIAVSGRVLAYPYEDRNSYEPGDAVCSGPNGTVSKMTRKEIMFYPERIIGTVSEIPEYDTWGEGNVAVKDRIWISIR